eukprot:m.371036 g.371036  ORF g.371036 m.371036 type:complete len:251 (-) comp56876_c0_seq1:282-1034(-)
MKLTVHNVILGSVLALTLAVCTQSVLALIRTTASTKPEPTITLTTELQWYVAQDLAVLVFGLGAGHYLLWKLTKYLGDYQGSAFFVLFVFLSKYFVPLTWVELPSVRLANDDWKEFLDYTRLVAAFLLFGQVLMLDVLSLIGAQMFSLKHKHRQQFSDFLKHARHPYIICPSIMLAAGSVVSLDRLMLVVILFLVYPFTMGTTDRDVRIVWQSLVKTVSNSWSILRGSPYVSWVWTTPQPVRHTVSVQYQ